MYEQIGGNNGVTTNGHNTGGTDAAYYSVIKAENFTVSANSAYGTMRNQGLKAVDNPVYVQTVTSDDDGSKPLKATDRTAIPNQPKLQEGQGQE